MASLRTSRPGGCRTALLAAFVLLAQGLWPVAAMPAHGATGLQIQMCTPGIDPDPAPAEDRQGAADCCGHCVTAAPAALPAAPAAAAPVRYEQAAVVHAAPATTPSPRARGPPRPPSQGPPALV